MQSLTGQLTHIKIYIDYLKPVAHSIFGGLLLSLSTSLLLYDYGRVFGCSGLIHSFVSFIWDDRLGPSKPRRNTRSIDTVEVGLCFGILTGGIILHVIQDQLETLIGKSIFDGFSSSSTLPSNTLSPSQTHLSQSVSWQRIPDIIFLVAGTLTGIGTKLSKGCTSGHMLCGVARLNTRSIVSTCIFFGTAAWTARVIRPLVLPVNDSPIGQFVKNDCYDHRVQFELTPLIYIGTSIIILTPLLIYYILRSDNLLSLFLSTTSSTNSSTSPRTENQNDLGDGTKLNTVSRAVVDKSHKILTFVRTACLGITFAYGLGIATMTRMSVILGFFNFPFSFLNAALGRQESGSNTQEWDPTLLGVVIGGLLPNVLVYLFLVRTRIRQWINIRSSSKEGGISDIAQDIQSAVASKKTEEFYSSDLPSIASKYAPKFSDSTDTNLEGWARLPEISSFFLSSMHLRRKSAFDPKLINGSILFGLGWGLLGLCPGPALVNLSASSASYLFSFLTTISRLFNSESIPIRLSKWIDSIAEALLQISARDALKDVGHASERENVRLILTWFGGFIVGSLLGREV